MAGKMTRLMSTRKTRTPPTMSDAYFGRTAASLMRCVSIPRPRTAKNIAAKLSANPKSPWRTGPRYAGTRSFTMSATDQVIRSDPPILRPLRRAMAHSRARTCSTGAALFEGEGLEGGSGTATFPPTSPFIAKNGQCVKAGKRAADSDAHSLI